jgi:hypothetical protein
VTYPQQPYGGQDPYPGYGGYGAPPPPPPKKNTAAVVAVVAAVVVLLAGLGITGFVAPGFFLSDDDDPPVGSPTTTQTTTSSTADPDAGKEVLAAVVEGLDSQDDGALEDVVCADAAPVVAEAVEDAEKVTGADLVDAEEVADDELRGVVEIAVGDESGEFEVTVTQVDDEWCWQDIELVDGPETSDPTTSTKPSDGPDGPGGGTPTAGGQPVPAEALAAMQMFLDAVNTGDAAAATATLCGDAISTAADVDELVGYDPELAIDPAMDGNASGSESIQSYLRGTAKGQDLEGYSTNLWVTSYDGPWCVHAFRAVVI